MNILKGAGIVGSGNMPGTEVVSNNNKKCGGQDTTWQGRSNQLGRDRKDQETRHIRQALINNGYPRGVLHDHTTPAPRDLQTTIHRVQ